MSVSPWYSPDWYRPAAKMLLFCLPYAGGGAALYHRWTRFFPPEIRLVPLCLPGRESRFSEPAYTDMGELVTQLAAAVEPLAQQFPYALFGHSMGAAVGFELLHALRVRACDRAAHFFVSACRGPRLPHHPQLMHELPTAGMIDAVLIRYGTQSTTSPDERALMELLAPTLRADLTLLETHTTAQTERLACGITALGGAGDPGVARHELESWSQETTGPFASRFFPGGHLYLRQHEARLAEYVCQRIALPT